VLTKGQTFLIVFLSWHIFLLLPFLVSKPSYSDAVLAYLALYPFFYTAYAVVNAARGLGSGGGQERLEGPLAAVLPLAPTMWMANVIREAEWWRSWDPWNEYLLIASLPPFLFYFLRSALRVDCRKVAEALAPLAVFHPIYAVVAMFSTAVVGVNVYRILLWYFAIYPAALATAVAGGRRLALLTALAVYLAAYALGAENLLLLLVAIPVAQHLGVTQALTKSAGRVVTHGGIYDGVKRGVAEASASSLGAACRVQFPFGGVGWGGACGWLWRLPCCLWRLWRWGNNSRG